MPSVETLEYYREAINEVFEEYAERIYVKRIDITKTLIDDLYGEATNPVYVVGEDGELPSLIAVVRETDLPKVLDKPMLHEDRAVTAEIPIQQEINAQFEVVSTDIIFYNGKDYRISSMIYDRPIYCDNGERGFLVKVLLLETK